MTPENSSLNKLSQAEITKRRKLPIAIMLVVLAITYVFIPILFFLNDPDEAVSVKNYLAYFTNENAVISFVIGLIGVYFAASTFHYLHVPRQVDFYESQPITRKSRFNSLVLNNLVSFVVPYVIFVFLGLVITATTGVNLIANGQVWGSTLAYVVVFTAFYAITSLAMLVTGNTAIAMLGTIFFATLEWIIMVVVNSFYSEFTVTGGSTVHTWMAFTNPWSQCFSSGSQPSYRGIAVNLLITFVYLLLAYYAYQHRKNELAGTAIVYEWIKQAVKVVVVLLASTIGAVMVYSMTNKSVIGGVLGAIIVGFLMAFILEIIFKFDIIAWKNHFAESAILVVLGIGVFLGLRYGGHQYDTWVPSEDQLASVAIATSEDSYSNYYLGNKETDAESYAKVYMKLSASNQLLALAKNSAENTIAERNDYYNSDHSGSEMLSFIYRLKNGKTQVRSYYVKRSDLKTYFEGVSQTAAFKKGFFQIYHDAAIQNNLDSVTFSYRNGEQTIQRQNGQLYQEFKQSYLTDLKQWDYNLASTKKPIGQVDVSWLQNGKNRVVSYPVYASYTKTVAFLKKNKLYSSKALSVNKQNPIEFYPNQDY
ncbi:DUF6449 domain-containing protein [Lactobacillus equicursoris]|uniref:DUF6449 domain-containing protein n=1 Tax=Lactobacillus equicursoris TaxID=420645 RepID=UPI001E5142D0|nr:DUF6449 domain-containing protein [Lactobacillus equicursoris]